METRRPQEFLTAALIAVVALGCAACTKAVDKKEIFAAGVAYYNEGNYIQAEKKFEQSLKLFTEKDGGSAELCNNEMYLANTKWGLGKFKDAMQMHKAALASMSKQYGPDSEQVADAELRLGIDCYSLNDKKTCKEHYESSLAKLKKHLPKTAAKVKQLQSKLAALAVNK